MPRQRRLILPGVAAHIIQRGNNRADCFRCDGDYLVYLSLLKELSARMDCALHAYCLMTNHVHMLMTPTSAKACSALMQNLGQRYVQYFNRRHARTGTLWEGRFLSSVVGSPEYVMACHRYIELNPVRAFMVSTPGAYRWSSHLGNVGLDDDCLLAAHPDYRSIGGHAAYAQLFADELPATMISNIREAVVGGYPLGDDAFKASLDISPVRMQRGKAGRPPRHAAG